MDEFLIDHATKNVWCTPFQDLQVIFQPVKVSQARGDQIYLSLMNQRYLLPNASDRFYVYQIGQVNPGLYNLLSAERQWTPLSKVSRDKDVIIDLYTDGGIHYPLFETWMMVTENKNLLIAVRHQPTITPSLRDTELYVRFYSNAYFDSIRSQSNPRQVYVYGRHITTTLEIVTLQNLYNDYAALPGGVYAFINGVFNTRINITNVAIGDVVEFYYDSSIKTVVEFAVDDLETFQSILDSTEKYLLHKEDFQTDTIEYQDDIDFFLVKKLPNNYNPGLYMHKNRVDAVRMVTHKDYAVPSDLIATFVAGSSLFQTIADVTIRIHVRHSGYQRPLVDEHNRIKELYKLTEEQRMMAFMGIDSTIPEWKAETLENGDYTRIMRQYHRFLTKELVTDAYGYNAISSLVGDSPLPVVNQTGTLMVELPVGLRTKATVYEYTSAGLLIDFYVHDGGVYYPVRNSNAAFVEAFTGEGTNSFQQVQGEDIVGKQAGVGYRLYKAQMVMGVITGEFEDVTGSADYTETASQFIWNVNQSNTFTVVRSDNAFLAYHLTMAQEDGLLRFNVQSNEVLGGVTLTRNVAIPPGRLDIWLNNRPLIEGVDFHVRWPEVCIVNKLYRVAGLSQKITVRAYGFCSAEMERETPSEWGFVSYGVLSRNGRFDIRDDKVMRFIAGGYVKRRQDITFQEDTDQLTVSHTLNGKPYLIWDQVVPIQNYATGETYSLRENSLELDGRISDYLTLKRPEPTTEDPSFIPYRYPLVSPFCQKIIFDLINEVIDPTFVESVYSSQDLSELLEPYEELLAFDPTQPDILLSEQNVIVHPHHLSTPMQLTIFQWQFVKKVIELYLYDRVDITQYVTIEVL